MMCLKLSFFLFCACLFMHASITLSQIQTNKLKFNKVVPDVQRMPIKTTAQDLCMKYKVIKGGTTRADYKSLLNKALMQCTKSEDSRWSHLNVGEVDLIEEDLSETDYQPPHRKSPIHNK